MLRGVFLENFVEFKTKQAIEFKENEGPSIFVGENGSGKSSLLEGIRRCLTSTRSTTRSSVYDEQKPSYFVCKYDTSKCYERVLKEIRPACMFSGILTQNKKDYKFVSTPSELFIDRRHKANDLSVSSEFQCEDLGDTMQIFNDLKRNTLNLNSIIDRSFTEIHAGDSKVKTESNVEQRLRILENYVIMTFPLRSIGPLQWSKSERIAEQKRQENYSEASRRAEIITYFLENKHEFNLEKEKLYFSGLTGRGDIEFELSTSTPGNIVVKSSETKLPGDDFALLKTPEGILEAKHLSILISSKQFLTLILEEPDRGMHPQMTERMLAIIQSESEKKLVVFTTHNPCFVMPTTISSLVIFKRKRPPKQGAAGKDRTEVISDLSPIFNADQHKPKTNLSLEPGMKTLRLLTRDHLTHFIFAKRILFCEGDSDFLFLTALKELIMKRSPGSYHVLQLIGLEDGGDPDITTLQQILVSIQVISMDGWNQARRMDKICRELKVDYHFFLCDKDAVIDNDKMTQANHWLENYKDIGEKFNKRKISWEDARQRLRSECKCFTWRDGTIEDMVISLLRSETRRTDTTTDTTEVGWTEKKNVIAELKNQYVSLPIHRWQERRQKENRKEDTTDKLFLSREVTQEGITKSVEIFLKACDKKSDDLVQFVQFLLQMDCD